jgi:hypothetical protein
MKAHEIPNFHPGICNSFVQTWLILKSFKDSHSPIFYNVEQNNFNKSTPSYYQGKITDNQWLIRLRFAMPA